MKPPYELSPQILKLITSISIKIGEVNAKYLVRQNPKLRKQNQIKTIHASLSIEGNTLSEEQMTAVIENKKVLGPEKDIIEVINAIHIYNQLNSFRYDVEKDFLTAHKILMSGLIANAGQYRTGGVGIVKGSNVTHLAPPSSNLNFLMKQLFAYLKDKSELTLIKSCVFHYEMEFIHPFADGNGRMGRLWQTLILMKEFPLFEYLPFESLIAKNQSAYYEALSKSDKAGQSTFFITFMLSIIDQSLAELLASDTKRLNETERLEEFVMSYKNNFTRKDYMRKFSALSTATASRDLKNGVKQGLIEKIGDKNQSYYKAI